MATTSSSSSSSVKAHKHADLEKEIASLAKSIDMLQKRLAKTEDQLAKAEAKLAKPVPAAAPSKDVVTRREWKIHLQKLGSYIGYRL